MEISKAVLEKTVAGILDEFQELALRRIEKVSQLSDFSFTDNLTGLTEDWRVSIGRLSGIRRLFERQYDEQSIKVYDYLTGAIEQLAALNSKASDKLLELSRASLARSFEEPVFAPTTQAIETVLLSSAPEVAKTVTPIQDGEISPVCNVNQYPPRCCDFCGEEYIPVVAFSGDDITGLILTSYCSDSCFHADYAGREKTIHEAA